MSRHVLITGAANGIGLACAQAFAASGDHVTGVDVREAELVEAMDELAQLHHVKTAAVVADLADSDCGQVITRAANGMEPIDVLVNAAGIYPATPFAQMSAQIWDRVQYVNVRAPVLLTVALAAQQRPAQAVVNIGSGAARRARPGAAHYCTSKAALEMVTKACAVELAGIGTRVNLVAPGFVDVDSPVNPVTDEYAEKVSVNPLGRRGRPEEIAAAAHWLASQDAAFITGAVLAVDGGATAGTTELPLHFVGATPWQSA